MADPDDALASPPVEMTGLDLEGLVRRAMGLAAQAGERGDPPFGALLVEATGRVVASAANRQVTGNDPTAHSELELLRAAAAAGLRLPLADVVLVVNAEPCSMCASAIVKAGVAGLVFGAPHERHMDPDLPVADVFARARRPPWLIGGVLGGEAAAQITSFRAGLAPVD